MSVSAAHPVLLPQRSRVAASGLALGTAVVAAVTVGLATDPSLAPSGRATVAVVGGLLALAGAAGAWRLGAPRGGMWWDPARRALGLGLTGPRDVWWLPRDRLQGLRISWRALDPEGDDVEWRAHLHVAGQPPILLVDSPERAVPEALVEALEERLDLPRLDAPPEAAADLRDDVVTFCVDRGVALHGVLALAGAGLALAGAALFGQVADHPFFAILVGPPVAVLGLGLLAVVGARRLGTEELRREGDRWTQRFHLGGRAWGTRTVTAAAPDWQVRVRPVRGARLELLADDGVLVLGAGATTRSRCDVETLAALPARFRRR